MFKLYGEIKTGKGSRKVCELNKGLAVGLTQTPIAATSFRKLMLSMNTPAPSSKGMQNTANVLNEEIVSENKKDMRRLQAELK